MENSEENFNVQLIKIISAFDCRVIKIMRKFGIESAAHLENFFGETHIELNEIESELNVLNQKLNKDAYKEIFQSEKIGLSQVFEIVYPLLSTETKDMYNFQYDKEEKIYQDKSKLVLEFVTSLVSEVMFLNKILVNIGICMNNDKVTKFLLDDSAKLDFIS